MYRVNQSVEKKNEYHETIKFTHHFNLLRVLDRSKLINVNIFMVDAVLSAIFQNH